MIYTYQHLLLISVCFFLMPLVDSASIPVPPTAPMQDQPVFNAWSDRSDERLVRITSAPNPEDAAGSTGSSDQEFALESSKLFYTVRIAVLTRSWLVVRVRRIPAFESGYMGFS